MVEKVKPLKLETGGDFDYLPTETDPTEDYLAAKGFALANSDNYLMDLDGSNNIQFKDATETIPVTVRQLRTATTNIFSNSGNGFVSTDVQNAIVEARDTASGKVRYTIQLIMNGSVSNGSRIAYSELLPTTPVIIPKNSILREITFSNQNTTTDAQFDIYRRAVPASTNGTGGATFLQSWVLTNQLSSVLSGLNYSFTAGQEILIRLTDTGDNPSDLAMALFFEVT